MGQKNDEQMPLNFFNLTDAQDENEDELEKVSLPRFDIGCGHWANLAQRIWTNEDWSKIQEAMCTYAAVFAYMKTPLVFRAFSTVNDRVRDIL